MASQLDAWWTCSYPRYSIRELSRLPIYHRFLQLHYPYEREDKEHSETFHCSDSEDSFQWIEQGRKERFTHIKGRDEYRYETEYQEKSYKISVESWTCREAEWGSIVKTYPQWELKEAWRSEGQDKTYERLSIEAGLKRGFRCGITVKDGETERWVEEIRDQPEENVFRKAWEKPGSSGGESHTKKGDYACGEEWLSDSQQEKKKCWHEENDHKWGYATGKKGRQETWEHQWDMDPQRRFEESLSFDGPRASGYRYSQQGEDWYKQEWQGPATIPLDKEREIPNAHLGLTLGRLYEQELAGSGKSDRTLRLLLLGAPGFHKEVNELAVKLAAFKPRASPDLAETAKEIEDLRALQDQQEGLKQQMLDTQNVTWRQLDLYDHTLKLQAEDSLATLKGLARVVQTDSLDMNIAKSSKEIERIATSESLNRDSRLEAWKTLLGTLEELKRGTFPSLQQAAGQTAGKPVEDTLRRQALEDSIRLASEIAQNSLNFSNGLNALSGDDDTKRNIEGISHVLDPAKATKSPDYLLALLGSLGSLGPIQLRLLEDLRSGAGGQKANDALTVTQELVPQVKELTSQLQESSADSTDETSFDDPFAREDEEKGPMTMSEGVADTRKGVALMGNLVKKAVETRVEMQETRDLLAPVTQEMRLLAEEMTAYLPESKPRLQQLPYSPASSRPSDAISWFALYIPFLRSLAQDLPKGKYPNPLIQEAMKILEPAQEELQKVTGEMAQQRPEIAQQLQKLDKEAEACFLDYKSNRKDTELIRGLYAVKAYFPLIRELYHGARTSDQEKPENSSLSDTVEELQFAVSDFSSATRDLSHGNSDISQQLDLLEAKSHIISPDGPTKSDLLRLIRLLRGYPQLLREINRRNGGLAILRSLKKALNDTHMEAVERAESTPNGDITRLHTEAEYLFHEENASPLSEKITTGLGLLRAYIPLLLTLRDHQFAKETEKITAETREIAEEMSAGNDKEKLIAIQREAASIRDRDKKPDFSVIRGHLPLIREIWRRRDMDLMANPAIAEAAAMLEANSTKLQALESPVDPSLQIFSQELASPLAAFKANSSPTELVKALKVFGPMVGDLIDRAAKRYNRLATSSEEPSAWTEAIETFSPVFDDADSIATEIVNEDPETGPKVSQIREKTAEARDKLRNQPNRENFLQAIGLLQPYFRAVRQSIKGLGSNGAMRLLRPAFQEAHREAEDLADEESTEELVFLKENVTALLKNHAKYPIKEHLTKAMELLAKYRAYSKGQIRRGVWRVLKPNSEEIHEIAGKVAPLDQERLINLQKTALMVFQGPVNRGNLNRIWSVLQDYFAYINGRLASTEKESQASIWLEVMNLLKGSLMEVKGLGKVLSDFNPILMGKMRELEENAFIPIRNFYASKDHTNIPKTVKAIKAFYPLLQELAKALRSRPKATPIPTEKEDSSGATLEETVEELRTTSEELLSLVNALNGDSSPHSGRIQAVAGAVGKSFSGYANAPGNKAAMRIVKMLRGYHPLLLELSRNSGLKSVMDMLEAAANDIHKETAESIPQDADSGEDLNSLRDRWHRVFTAFKAAPKEQHVGEAVDAIRGYSPYNRHFAWRYGLKLLEPLVNDTNGLAEELAVTESDREVAGTLKREAIRPITEAKQETKRHHFHQALTALAGYIPLLRRLAFARASVADLDEIMKILAPSKREIAIIAANLASGAPTSEAEVSTLSETAEIPLKDYQISPSFQYIPKAASAIRSFYPLIQQLLSLRSRSDEDADENISIAMRELEPAAKDITALGRDIAEDDLSQVEIIENLHNSLESVLKEFKSTAKKEHIVRGIQALRRFFPALREMLGKGNRFRNVMELLEPVLVETHKEAVEMAENDFGLAAELQQLERDSIVPFREYRIAYKREQVHQALAALRAYHPFFRHYSWRYAVKQLEGVTDLAHTTAEHLASGVPSARDTLRTYRQDSSAAIAEHRATPKLRHVQQLTTILGSYLTFLRTLPAESGSGGAVPVDDQPDFTVTEAIAALEPHQKELESLATLLSDNDAAYHPRLTSLRTDSLQPLEEYKKSPQSIYLPRAIKALYEYHPLLKELAAKRKEHATDSDAERDAVMNELEQHALEISELVEEIGEGESDAEDRANALKSASKIPFQEHRKSPNRKLFLPAIRGIRAFHPFLLELARKMGIRSAMEALEPTVSSLRQMASDLSSEDSDLAVELHQLELESHSPFKEFKKTPRRLYFHKALKALRDYHPFLRRYWWRRAMKHLATVVPEYDGIVVKRYPQLAGKVGGLRERLATALKDYQSVYTPGKLAEAVEVLRTYHRLIAENTQEEGKEAVGTTRMGGRMGSTGVPAYATSQDISPVTTKMTKVGAAPGYVPSLNTTQSVVPVSTKVTKVATTPTTVPTTTTSTNLVPVSTKVTKITPISPAIAVNTLQPVDSRTPVTRNVPIGQPSPKLNPVKSSPTLAAKPGSTKLKSAHPATPTRREASSPFASSRADDASLPTPTPGDPSRPSLVLNRASVSDLEQAEALLNSEKQEAVTHNLILQNLQSASVPTDKPLTYLNIFKFFEELMDAKFDVDSKDLKARRKPRGMTEFLMEHLNRQFGIKALGMKFLGQLVPGLQLLYNENLPYAVLFARLLQVFSPDPIPFNLAMFLTKVRLEFHRLMEKCSKEREKKAVAAIKKTKGAQPVTHGKAAYDLAATGGEAFTSDVMMLIYELFENDPESGELALDLLRPENVSHSDYVLYKVCHRMGKMGMNPEAVFNLIDADHGGSIDEEEFVQGIKSSLELWIPEQEIRSVHSELATNGVLSRHAFLARCSFDWYYSVVKSDDYITTKCQFLNVLIDVYTRRVRQDTGMLIALYESKAENPMTKDTLSNLLTEMDPINTEDRINAIWTYGMDQAGDSSGLLPTSFVKTMLKYRSGQLAQTVFCKVYADLPEIEKAIEDRKMETVDINLSDVAGKKGGSVTVKTTTTVKVANRPARGVSKH